MDLAIVDLARRMRQSFMLSCEIDCQPWESVADYRRRAWVAAAIVARPDLVEGIAVPPDHWLAGVLPVVDPFADALYPEAG